MFAELLQSGLHVRLSATKCVPLHCGVAAGGVAVAVVEFAEAIPWNGSQYPRADSPTAAGTAMDVAEPQWMTCAFRGHDEVILARILGLSVFGVRSYLHESKENERHKRTPLADATLFK